MLQRNISGLRAKDDNGAVVGMLTEGDLLFTPKPGQSRIAIVVLGSFSGSRLLSRRAEHA